MTNKYVVKSKKERTNSMSTKSYKRKKGYSHAERQAFWLGVGLSVARDHELYDHLVERSDFRRSIIAGYEADNRRNVGAKFAKKKGKTR